MSAPALDKKMSNYWPRLNDAQKKSLVQVMENYLAETKDDHDRFVPELGCTINEYNREIEEAEAEIDRGEFYTHEQVKERIKQWKTKYSK